MVAAVATLCLYGGSLPFTKNVTTTIDPFTLLGWRFFVAFVTLLVLMLVRVIRVRPTRATLRPLLLLAVFQPVIYYVCETYGVRRTTASESALILAVVPVAMMLAAMVFLRRRPTRWQVAGISVTLVGVTITVVAGGLTAAFNLIGYVLVLAAVISYALYAVFADRYAAAASDVDKTFFMVAAGALFFGTITLAQHGAGHTLGTLVTLPFTNPSFAIAVAYLALGSTIGAFFLQNVAIGILGSTRYSTYVGLATVTTLLAGALTLGERLSVAQWIGGGIILAGVYLANWRAGAADPAVPAADEARVSPSH